MNKLVMKTLSPLKMPVFFIEQGEQNTYPQIVFNIKDTPWEFSDDEQDGCQYEINMSLLVKGDYLQLKKEIERLMVNAGFKKGRGYYPEYSDQLECYIVPLRFYYYKLDKGEMI